MNYLTTTQYLKKNWKVALFFALWALGSVWYYFAIVSKIEPPTELKTSTQRTIEEIFGREIPQGFEDRNCSEFDTQKQAQTFFEAEGGLIGKDPHKLDANNNGIACESL